LCFIRKIIAYFQRYFSYTRPLAVIREMNTDWKKIGTEIGSVTENSESGGTEYAKLAFENIFGEKWIKETVEKAISNEVGAELAMNCLRLISSELAADYAYSIYKSDINYERKNMAVWLIKHLAVKKSYDWIEEFINDRNVGGWGIDVLDQLLWTEKIDYEYEKERVDYLLNLAIVNSDGELKENVDFINEYLSERAEVE